MERLPWWQEFVDRFGSVRLAAQRVKSTAVKKLTWLVEGCSKAFASVCLTHEKLTGQDAYDFAWLFIDSVLDVGRKKGARACEDVADFVGLLDHLTSDRVALNRWAPV
jgi:hypothetical protein